MRIMLDFTRPIEQRRTTSAFKRRSPLLLLIFALGLAVILIDWARKPEHWKWIEAFSAKRPVAEKPAVAPRPSGALPEVPGIDPRYLAGIRDDTLIRTEEDDAWFQLCDILLRLPPAELQKFSAGRVSYAQLFHQSDVYRGKLVELHGTIRRVESIPVRKKGVDIKGYYRTWLSPDDNPSSPIIVYCLTLPKDFPQEMNVAEEVGLKGFFFKRLLYSAGDPSTKKTELRTAPMVLTKDLQWKKRPPPPPKKPVDVIILVIVLAVSLGASLLVAWYGYARTRRHRAIGMGTK
jgi:hypothetical protein